MPGINFWQSDCKERSPSSRYCAKACSIFLFFYYFLYYVKTYFSLFFILFKLFNYFSIFQFLIFSKSCLFGRALKQSEIKPVQNHPQNVTKSCRNFLNCIYIQSRIFHYLSFELHILNNIYFLHLLLMLIGPNFPQVYIKLSEAGKAKLISGGSKAATHKPTVVRLLPALN